MLTRIRADFAERVVLLPHEQAWVSSPTPGVERILLDRIGDEIARATSLVRFAPNTVFPEHVHGGGEEFFVLSGSFEDAEGQYPAGTYVRNPIGTRHTPRAGCDGAMLFVKLHQFATADQTRVVVHSRAQGWLPGGVSGLAVLPLHRFGDEAVALVRWAAQTRFHPHTHWGGEEILVIEGVLRDEHGHYPERSWLRSPHLSTHTPYIADEGATILVKVGHLLPSERTWHPTTSRNHEPLR